MSTVNIVLTPVFVIWGWIASRGTLLYPFPPSVKTNDVWWTGPGMGQCPIRPHPDTKASPESPGDKDTNPAGFCYFAYPCHWPRPCRLPSSLPSLSVALSQAARGKEMSSQTCPEKQKSSLPEQCVRDLSILILEVNCRGEKVNQ